MYEQEVTIEMKWWQTCPGVLWGFDSFMNLVMDDCVEMATGSQQNNIRMLIIEGNNISV